MKAPPKNRPLRLVFAVKPRLLTLLGDQLIRDATVAVFELVKNAYDADASACKVILTDPESAVAGQIVIQDDGSGMSERILEEAWMTIGTDFRAQQRHLKLRTSRFQRFPLGEKGLGRLSVHKLGRLIKLITREEGGRELVMEFDWDKLETAETMKGAAVVVQRREPRTFKGSDHGTRIEVSRLREEWSRGEVRRLYRSVNSLRSPFKGPTDFAVSLHVPGNEDWLSGMFTSERAAECAVYRVRGHFEGKHGDFKYTFVPPPGMQHQLAGRTVEAHGLPLQRRDGRKSISVDLTTHAIGVVSFEFWLFDRDPSVMRRVTDDVKGLKDYLNENGGVRIYRDGIRVYDFGEPGNDWLNLDLRRVNTPTARISNNQVLGALQLDATTSSALREKSNREGFIETSAFSDFRHAVVGMLTHIEAERTKDQRRLREALGKSTGQRVFTRLAELRESLGRLGILAQLEPQLKSVEMEMETYRDQLLHAAVPGLTIGIMLHGAEKILSELREAARKHADIERIRELVEHLYRAMRPVTNLLKNPGTATTSAGILIREAIFSTELRLRRHHVRLINGMASESVDFQVRGSKQMLVASITNLVDNSIHWLEAKDGAIKLLYVGTTREIQGGPAIIVADNGPGFGGDAPEDLISPFFTRRTGGMGLGLYIVSEVMRVSSGRIVFPDVAECDLPEEISGAVVALQFPEIA